MASPAQQAPRHEVKMEDVDAPAALPAAADPAVVQNKAEALYEKCAQAPEGTVFFQRDLSNMAVAENLAELIVLLQQLVDKHLMKLMQFDNEPCWKIRTREVADK
jgi:DNA-directed RNA polymerase III subunit RPC6